MKNKFIKIFSFFTILSIIILPLTSSAISAPYKPGETLDPACSPGEANCYVQQPWASDTSTTTTQKGVVIQQNIETTGPELITNGTFTGGTTGWTLGNCASYANNEVTIFYNDPVCNNTSISFPINVEIGKTYVVNYTISNATSQSSIFFYNLYSYADYAKGNGTHNFLVTSDYTGADEIFFNLYEYTSGLGYTIDNVSMKEVSSSQPASSLSVLSANGTQTVSIDNSLYSNFIGEGAGYYDGVSASTNSNFFGVQAGYGTSAAYYSNFLGVQAGYQANNARASNFFGFDSGYQATTANNSNFFGDSSGYKATGASRSNFLGNSSGYKATSASYSNFLGFSSGYKATNASSSSFIGNLSGYEATNANNSNFVGSTSGRNATNAELSNFFGREAGDGATNAAHSIFIGWAAGLNDTVNNTSGLDYSILIGNNTSTGGFSNSIALGSNAVNTAVNQLMIGSTTRPINTTRINGASSTQCTITTGTGIACTSDERLKTNITDLPSDTLDKLTNLKTVTYNWTNTPNTNEQIGFLAQNLETYFPQLVATDSDGYKSVYYSQMTPILTQAIKEMNLKIQGISDTNTENSYRETILSWFSNVGNKIESLFVKVLNADKVKTKELCIEDVCVTKDELLKLKNNNQNTSINPTPELNSEIITPIVEPVITTDPIVEPVVTEPIITTTDPVFTPEVVQ